MNFVAYISVLYLCTLSINAEITPYKYTDEERKNGLAQYKVPPECRFLGFLVLV